MNNKQKTIPNGWKEAEVSKFFSYVRTYAVSRDNLISGTVNNSGIGNIHYGDIHSTYNSSSIDLKTISVPRVKDDSFSPNKDDFLKNGDLIMADASEDYEGVGVTVSLHGLEGKKVVGGLHTFVLRDINKKTDERYRQYIFRNPVIRNKLQKIANGVSVYGISKTALSKIVLSLPPLPEQKRIVAVLETWDQAIEKLAKKIEIKKNIKKGLMQNLLAGKKRLAGFKDKWRLVKMEDIATISRGGSPRPIESFLTKDENGLNWLRIGDIKIGGKYIYKTREKIIKEGLNKTTQVEVDDFILSNSMSYGRPYIMKTEACIHDGWLALKNISEGINREFLYYLLLSEEIQNQFTSLSAGSGVQNLKKETVQCMTIQIPPIDEQDSIACILISVDLEIECLNKKMKIIKNQKRYLLNNLIIGNIRTPENLEILKQVQDDRIIDDESEKLIRIEAKEVIC